MSHICNAPILIKAVTMQRQSHSAAPKPQCSAKDTVQRQIHSAAPKPQCSAKATVQRQSYLPICSNSYTGRHVFCPSETSLSSKEEHTVVNKLIVRVTFHRVFLTHTETSSLTSTAIFQTFSCDCCVNCG